MFKKSSLLYWVVWLALGGVLYMLSDAAMNPNRAKVIGNGQEVTLLRDLSGHYRAEILINGHTVYALLDTGATSVAVPGDAAERLGLKRGPAMRIHTANGDAVAYATRLESVKVGGIEALDVAATITPGMDGDILLGMSFLSHMDIRLQGDRMILSGGNP
jgi:aspartyl protease family protein